MTLTRAKDVGKPTSELGGGVFAAKNNPDGVDGLIVAPHNPDTFTARPLKGGEYSVHNDHTLPPAVQHDGFKRQIIAVGGVPYANARQTAIAAIAYSDEERVEAIKEARSLAESGEKMTLLFVDGRGNVSGREGTGVVFGGRTAILKKGTQASSFNGVYLGMDLAAVKKGYGHIDKLVADYDERAALVPQLDKPTFDDIPTAVTYADDGDDAGTPIAAVFMMDGPRFDEEDPYTHGCMIMVTDIQDGEIANGYLWAPDGTPVEREHGSWYVKDLERKAGRVRGYESGTLTFGGVMNEELGGTYESAYEALGIQN